MVFQKGHKINNGRKHFNRKSIKPTEEHKRKLRKSLKITCNTQAFKEKMSKINRGKNCHWWRGGITSIRIQIKNHYKYRQWISDVFTRDDYTCQECSQRGVRLSAHHIKTFSKIIRENNVLTLEEALNCEELWNINNGITLCFECHKKTDTYGRNIN